MIKNIPGYNGIYKITCSGDVWSCHGISSCKKLKTQIDRHGRVRVHLYQYAKRVNYQVHRLVCMTYLDTYSEKLTVNHLDGNPKNNNISNLEMCTVDENLRHALLNGYSNQKGQAHSQAKLSDCQVLEIKEILEGKVLSQRQIARIYGVHFNTISQIYLGTRWGHLT